MILNRRSVTMIKGLNFWLLKQLMITRGLHKIYVDSTLIKLEMCFSSQWNIQDAIIGEQAQLIPIPVGKSLQMGLSYRPIQFFFIDYHHIMALGCIRFWHFFHKILVRHYLIVPEVKMGLLAPFVMFRLIQPIFVAWIHSL